MTFAYAGQEIPTVELAVNDGKSITNEMIYGEIHGMKKDEDGKEETIVAETADEMPFEPVVDREM